MTAEWTEVPLGELVTDVSTVRATHSEELGRRLHRRGSAVISATNIRTVVLDWTQTSVLISREMFDRSDAGETAAPETCSSLRIAPIGIGGGS